MQAKVKICGIKVLNDAIWASNLGADFIGVNFYKNSPRFVSIIQAAKIKKNIPEFIKLVGVFVNPEIEEIDKVLSKVKLWGIQLHGTEQPEFCKQIKDKYLDLKLIKAFRVKSERSVINMRRFTDCSDYFLFDAYSETEFGGTGEVFDWSLIDIFKELNKEFFIAGGLKSENLKEVIEKTKPFAVDVAGGVEKDIPGKKDYELLKNFIFEAKRIVY